MSLREKLRKAVEYIWDHKDRYPDGNYSVEMPDPTKMEIEADEFERPLSLAERLAMMNFRARLDAAAEREGFETASDADDFNLDDEELEELPSLTDHEIRGMDRDELIELAAAWKEREDRLRPPSQSPVNGPTDSAKASPSPQPAADRPAPLPPSPNPT